MQKKLILACLAITAFAAFVVSPAAPAATLTEGVIAVPNGTSWKAAGTEAQFIAGTNTVTCSSASMSGTVTTNSSGAFAAEIAAGNPSFTGTASGGDCTSNGLGAVKPTVNSKQCLGVPKGTDIGSITGCAGAAVTFTLNITSLGILCRYEKASIGIEVTTAPIDAAYRILPGERFLGEAPNSQFCPTALEYQIEQTLTTTDGTTLLFS